MHPDNRLGYALDAIRADACEARALDLAPCSVHPGLVRALRALADVTGATPPNEEALGLAIALSLHRAYAPLISSPDDVRAVFEALVAESGDGSIVLHDEHGTFTLRDAEATPTGAVGWAV